MGSRVSQRTNSKGTLGKAEYIFSSVQFSSRWYLCARKSPYALHPVCQKFPQHRLWLKRFQFYSSDCMTMALSRPFKEDCLASFHLFHLIHLPQNKNKFKNEQQRSVLHAAVPCQAQQHRRLLAPFPQTLSELHVPYTPSKAGGTHLILICAHLSVCRTRTYN